MLHFLVISVLNVFYRSRLFREFKMCKLLMRPLDDRFRSASRGSSRNLRGYSRQTESYVSSLSNSADNSANDATTDYEDGTWSGFRRSALFRYQRPGSNAISLPPGLGLCELSQVFFPFIHCQSRSVVVKLEKILKNCAKIIFY